ncbi:MULTISPECIES: LysR family transcriptional regulator [Pseudomonas]|uniref:LysR family transcriptional regulator n=1 Tax=Pseudomonas TaxID=286 RepID=UPI0018D67D78|nr:MULTISPECIES: LysR family transcriptional regulator [Pseudomonas]MBH3408421.1 LysR family transcriptional regulator [Pseudomonas glycinae]MDI3399412.1 LysR family transcriptional regulator [Pseudomonas sp. V88_4]
MDLKRLSHLLALADERHFGRAAERVHLSQPALSRSIQALESETGQRLFDRDTGDVRPTPAGEFLIERARRLLFDARSLERDMALYSDRQLGSLAFGVGPFPAAMLMHQVVPRLRLDHPAVTLRVEVNNWQILEARLRAEAIEFFVADIRNFTAESDLLIRSLGQASAGFFVRPEHPLAGHKVTMGELEGYGIATTRLPEVVKLETARTLGISTRQALPIVLECDDVALLKTVAGSTDTILGVIHGAVAEDIRAGRLIELHVVDRPGFHSEIGVVSLQGRSLSPTALCVIEAVVAEMQSVHVEQSPRL